MSVYPKPTTQQGSIFNPDLWIVSDVNGVSVDYLNENYLQFPVAQGFETLNGMTNLQTTTIGKNLIMNGTYLTNYIEFPDGSQQFAASGGGSGDALLAGGTSTTPQNFTGFNEFSNADGQIALINTTSSHIVSIACDNTTNNQLDINGGLQITGSGFPILMEAYSDATNALYGLQVSGGGLFLGSNGGSTSSSPFVQLACLDGGDNQLYVGGSILLSNSTLTNSVTISAGSTGLVLNTGLSLVNTVSSVESTSTLIQSPNLAETVQFGGNLQLFGGTTNRTIFLNYSGQGDIEIYQNLQRNFETNSGLVISPNVEDYPSNTNRITLYADDSTNNQLNVGGDLLTTGNITLGSGSTSGASLTFGDGSVQTSAATGTVLATYTSSALDTSISPYVWSITGISNQLGGQVSWVLYSNTAITTSSSSTVFSTTSPVVVPSGLGNYIYGSGTAIQIPYKYNDGTSTTNQTTYNPSVVVALGGYTLSVIGNTFGTSTFRITINSTSNTDFTNGSRLILKFYAN